VCKSVSKTTDRVILTTCYSECQMSVLSCISPDYTIQCMLHVCMYESVHCVTGGPTREPHRWGCTKSFIPAAPQQNKYRTMLTIIKGSCPWKRAPYIYIYLTVCCTHSVYYKKMQSKLQLSKKEVATLQSADPMFRSINQIRRILMLSPWNDTKPDRDFKIWSKREIQKTVAWLSFQGPG
jgi:hypothetical protein